MILGLVSNCWRTQLLDGVDLVELIDEAMQRGYRAVELRQTCLGHFETDDEHVPLADALAALPGQFPAIRFNIAINVPCFNSEMTADDSLFQAARLAAFAVSGEFPPHLRLVDLTTVGERLDGLPAEAAGESVARLTRSMAEFDGVLSIENSLQPWAWFRRVFDSARDELGNDADRLKLCFDPCNLLMPGDGVEPLEVTDSLSATDLSMVHFKQRREGKIYPAVSDGDIDWAGQLSCLNQKHYQGAALFEVEPHKRIWEYLKGSVEYLRRAGLDVAADVG